MNEPICADCSHLIGVRSNKHDAKQWKCGKGPSHKDSVSGLMVYDLTCYEARAEGRECGPAGKLFAAYTPPEHTAPSRGGQGKSADSLLGELGL